VSHLGETEHKTLLLKNKVNVFSNSHFYSHFEKKSIQISKQNLRNGEENKSIYKEITVLRYELLKFWDRFP